MCVWYLTLFPSPEMITHCSALYQQRYHLPLQQPMLQCWWKMKRKKNIAVRPLKDFSWKRQILQEGTMDDACSYLRNLSSGAKPKRMATADHRLFHIFPSRTFMHAAEPLSCEMLIEIATCYHKIKIQYSKTFYKISSERSAVQTSIKNLSKAKL